MSHSVSPSSSLGSVPTDPIQSFHDQLILDVQDQISLGTFDATNQLIISQLVAGLGDPRGLVRLQFAEVLGEIGEITTPFLLDALAHSPNVVVRRAAAKTLTIIADPTAVNGLIHSFLHDEDTVVKGSSAGALARTGEVAVPALLEILASPNQPEDIKGHAAWALAFIGAEGAEHLYNALNSASLDVRCAVISALGHVAQEQGDDKSCQLLTSALTDPEALIRTEAASALGQVHYPAAIPHLILALRDSDLDVRKAAINALGKSGDSQVLNALQALLTDNMDVIRILAKVAIAQIERQVQTNDWD